MASCKEKKEFLCSLSNQIMVDPVVDREGNSYEREAITQWLVDRGNNRSPVTGSPLHISHLQANESLKKKIRKECDVVKTILRQENNSGDKGKGVKRFFKRINPFKKSPCDSEFQIVIDNPPPSPVQTSTSTSSPTEVVMKDVSEKGNDDASTLATPMDPEGIISSEEYADAPMFGDQSLSTYANSRFFNRGGSSVSDTSAGITLETRGAFTQGTGSGADTLFDNSNAGGMMMRGASCYSIVSDDSFFNPQNSREVVIEVEAPPGKLGISIDTPEDGSDPIIHDVKEFSSIADQMEVGDRLIAIDGEDVRYCTAVKIAKLISKKASNPVRILTVVRTIVDDHQNDLLGPRHADDDDDEW